MESIKTSIRSRVVCPCCKKSFTSNNFYCDTCDVNFPIVQGVPILIDDTQSIFKRQDFVNQKDTFFDHSTSGSLRSKIAQWLPSITSGHGQRKRFKMVQQLLIETTSNPKVLILGGSIIGGGMEDFLATKEIDFIESDVSFGPRTKIILDAHTIPYEDATFDGVIAQAVLEHVVDPYQCAAEISRVLKPGGVVYSEIPFMQQVHGGDYDFTRFTLRGHRNLFKNFSEISLGSVAGSGSVMAWSYQYLLLSLFGHTPSLRYCVKAFARLTGFWLKYFDYLELENKYKSDGASVTFFMGKKL